MQLHRNHLACPARCAMVMAFVLVGSVSLGCSEDESTDLPDAAESTEQVEPAQVLDELLQDYRTRPTHHEVQRWTFEPLNTPAAVNIQRPEFAEIEVALDRPRGRLYVRITQKLPEEAPSESLLVIADGRMYYRTSDVQERYVDVPAPDPLTAESIAQQLPMMGPGAVPVLALLLSDKPLEAMLGVPITEQTAMMKEGNVLASIKGEDHQRTLIIAPKARQVTQVRISDIRRLELFGEPQSLDYASHYKAEIVGDGRAAETSFFTFDPAGATAVSDLRQLYASQGSVELHLESETR